MKLNSDFKQSKHLLIG